MFSSISQSRISRTGRRLGALAGVGALALSASPALAVTAGVQYTYPVQFASGAQSVQAVGVTPVTVATKILVIQTVSIYHSGSSASLQCFLAVPAQGTDTGFIALNDILGSSTDTFPASTANLTAYVPAGKQATVNCYRTGGTYPAETVYVTVTGNVTAP